MNDDELLHRYLEGSLTASERAVFDERCTASPALRAAAEFLASHPAPEPPGTAFDERVLALARAQAPRRLPVRGRVWALAVAASLAAFALGLGAGRGFERLEEIMHPGRVRVEFVFRETGAAAVSVVGHFNAWDSAAGSMQRTASGWRRTLWLEPGVHEYQFVIDGERRVADPAAPAAADDGFGERNSILHVAPAQAL